MTIKPILHSFEFCLDYLRDQVADLDATQMVTQPGEITNHPAWVIGHLTFSCQAIGGEIGLAEWLPAHWAQDFGTGSVPIPDASHYRPKGEALEMLGDAQTRIALAVERLGDAQLDAPLPDEHFRDTLPTIRHALTQVLVAHPANHIGQLTIWRRALGLPQIERPFL